MWSWDTTLPTAPPVATSGNPIYDSLTFGSRSYELSNHLGNVLSTISDKKIGNDSSGIVNYYIAEVLSQNDYYPFGMGMPGRSYSAGSGYRYGFNGKENDNEVKGEANQQDYGMRIYDPRLGRFLSVDPIGREYPELTPYQFASNRPIDGIDMDGLEWAPPMKLDSKTGKHVVDADAAVAIHTHKNNLLAVVVVADVVITKGWLTRIYLASEAASLFEHNRAKTAEGRGAQDERIKENAANFIIDAGFGLGISKLSKITFFKGPAKEDVYYLFRGTSEGFEGSAASQKLGITPTSSDPGVATIFAINAKNSGKGVLQVALPENLQGASYTGNVLQSMEKEIGVGLKPGEFTKKISVTITADQARDILKKMGINLPSKININEINEVIRNTPKLTQTQIDEFYIKANSIGKH